MDVITRCGHRGSLHSRRHVEDEPRTSVRPVGKVYANHVRAAGLIPGELTGVSFTP